MWQHTDSLKLTLLREGRLKQGWTSIPACRAHCCTIAPKSELNHFLRRLLSCPYNVRHSTDRLGDVKQNLPMHRSFWCQCCSQGLATCKDVHAKIDPFLCKKPCLNTFRSISGLASSELCPLLCFTLPLVLWGANGWGKGWSAMLGLLPKPPWGVAACWSSARVY